MPTYLTVTDLQDILSAGGQATTGTAASLPVEVLADRLAAAEQVVDARLAVAGYTTPTLLPDGGVPPLVAELTGAIGAYLADLVYRRGKAHESTSAPVILRYQWATTTLGEIGDRILIVPGVEQDLSQRGPGAEAVEAIEPYEGRLFGLDIIDVGPRLHHPDWWW